LIDNDSFKQFDRETRAPFQSGRHGSVVRATIVGRYFAGENRAIGGRSFPGYGHMGCCTLLAIQMIKTVDPQDRNDLDYSASSPMPDGNYQFLTPIYPGVSLIEDQEQADLCKRAWAFTDPGRVAAEALVGIAKLEVTGPMKLKVKQKSPGSITYDWRQSRSSSSYSIVVSRPSFLSYYDEDSKRVAWVVTAVYRISGGD